MCMKPKVFTAFCAVLLSLLTTSIAPAQVTADRPAVCENVDSIETCHSKYPAGCSDTDTYDAYINTLKNQTPSPSATPVATLTKADIERLEAQVPDGLNKWNHGRFAKPLAQLGEGKIYTLIGYFYYGAETRGHKRKDGTMHGESANCDLWRPGETDFHLGIGFTPLAVPERFNARQSRESAMNSIVVEMTPHYRARFHPQWTVANLEKVLGGQVKIVGQFMLDNDHLAPSKDCGRPDADKKKCWRMSVWEIHPVTQFYVCKTGAVCASAEDPNWVRLPGD